jgi:hypothetical protein
MIRAGARSSRLAACCFVFRSGALLYIGFTTIPYYGSEEDSPKGPDIRRRTARRAALPSAGTTTQGQNKKRVEK